MFNDNNIKPMFVKSLTGNYYNVKNIISFEIIDSHDGGYPNPIEFYYVRVWFSLEGTTKESFTLFIENAEDNYKHSNKNDLSLYLDYYIKCLHNYNLPNSIDEFLRLINLFDECKRNSI